VQLTSRAHLRRPGDSVALRCVDMFDNVENMVAGCVLSGFVLDVMGLAAGSRNGAFRRITKRIVVGSGRTVGTDGGGDPRLLGTRRAGWLTCSHGCGQAPYFSLL